MEIEQTDEFDGPSKSQRKRDAHKLQELGMRLTECSETQLLALEIPARTIAALAEYNRLPNSHGARRRQLQFIGKLMRALDYEQVSTALERLEKKETHQPKPVALSKMWTDKILQAGDEEINSLLETNSMLERQKLRQFYRDFQAATDASRARVRGKLQRYLQPYLDN